MDRPTRILQFGDGVFIRAFIDWMVQRMNEAGRFDGSVVVVKPRPGDFSPAYARQGNAFTVALKGILDGQRVESRERVSSIARLVNPYADHEAFLAEGRNPDLACIVSNTTESGIAPSPGDGAGDRPAPSFPGKLTQLLRERYESLGREEAPGLVIIPLELIEGNAALLRGLVLGHASRWYGDAAFESWLLGRNTWVESLVDRIVTGFTAEEKAAILAAEGFEDDLVAVAEPYHFLALKGPASLEAVLPFRASGLNVVWAEDIGPWRELKVRLLNGSHSLLALCAPALGKRTVLDCVRDPLLMGAVRAYQEGETLPAMAAQGPCRGMPREEILRYLNGVLERFSNPDLAHALEGIASKSVAKFRSRILPTIQGFVAATGRAPILGSLALAALAERYAFGAPPQDEAAALAWFAGRREAFATAPRRAFLEALGSEGPWGVAIAGTADLAEAAATALVLIREQGMEAALRDAMARAGLQSPGM